MTYYNLEFKYYNRMSDQVESHTMRNLVGKRVMQIRRTAFAEGLFVPSDTAERDANAKIFPFVVGVVIPPADIKGVVMTVIAITLDEKTTPNDKVD